MRALTNFIWTGLFSVFGTVVSAQVQDVQDVWITPDLPYVEFEVGNDFFLIERNQDSSARISDAFAKTSRPCPPFCVQPMVVADGVETVGEIELLDFVQDYVQEGTGYLIDARVESFFRTGTIPGAVNMPFNMFSPSPTNPFLDQLLVLLGGSLQTSGKWDFSNAKDLLIFCNGPWCAQAPAAIHNLLGLGYPPSRLRYYRGGMQSWASLGLSIFVSQ